MSMDGACLPLDERLERGELVVFERCPFPLPAGEDLEFLLACELDGVSKSITLFPDTGLMGGHCPAPPAGEARLKQLLGDFSREATSWLAGVLPRYHAAMRFGPLRFRVAEERGRIIDPRLTGRLLHVDANSDMPASGDSFLRIFVNINPERDREWLTSLPLAALLDQWGDSVRVAGEGRASLRTRLHRRFGRALGWAQPADTSYDELMMRLHFYGKTDPYLQERAPRTRWVFPPGSAWVVFSDLVSHAVVGGQYAIDQTYLVPARAFRRPGRSTKAVIERFWAGRRAPAAGGARPAHHAGRVGQAS
jgi:hypothetical protein